MPSVGTQLALALIDFLKWVRIFADAGAGKGVLRWEWFASPGQEVLKGMGGQANRKFFEAMVNDLLVAAGTKPQPQPPDGALFATFTGTLPASAGEWHWTSLQAGSDVGIGFAWTAQGPLRLGLAASATSDGQLFDPGLIVGLMGINPPDSVEPPPGFARELGHVRVGSRFPTPDFLQSITLVGDINPSEPGVPRSLVLTVVNANAVARVLDTTRAPAGWDTYDAQVVAWGDGSGVPTSGNKRVIVGTDTGGVLHFRIFDDHGVKVLDTDESKLPAQQNAPVMALKSRIPGLLSPHPLTADEKAQLVRDVRSIVGYTAWDSLRIPFFVIESWVRFQGKAAGAETFPIDPAHPPDPQNVFYRLDRHLLPLLGEPPGITTQFPLLMDVGSPVDFAGWAGSFIKPTSPGATVLNTLVALWHLRALLNSDESPISFGGSAYFSLDGPPGLGQQPTGHEFAATPRPAGVYVAIVDHYPPNTNNPPTILLVIQIQNDQTLVPLLVQNATIPTIAAPLSLPQNIPLPLGCKRTFGVKGNTITLFSEDVNAPVDQAKPFATMFNGTYSAKVQVNAPGAVSLALGLPGVDANHSVSLPIPPRSAEEVIGPLAHWTLGAATRALGPASSTANLFTKLAPLVETAFTDTVDPASLVQSLVEAFGTNLSLKVGNRATVNLKWPTLSVSLELPDLLPANQGSWPITVGRLVAGAGFDLKKPAPSSASLAIFDVRLRQPAGDPDAPGPGNAGAGSLAGKLLPDLTDAEGFTLHVDWKGAGQPQISGGGKVAVQKNLGPLNVGALYVTVANAGIDLGVDLSFQLGPVVVAAHDLGVNIAFQGPQVTPRLKGLGISLDAEVAKLAGEFGEVAAAVGPPVTPPAPPEQHDYVGTALVTVVDLFQLSAIGGYTQAVDIQSGKSFTSVFVFASLVAPLGGPPFFFVTGIAGGFGYNRTLPPPALVQDHPFLQVMDGRIKLDQADTKDQLVALSQAFMVAPDVYWVAAGVQFLSFGFIHGTIIAGVQFGQKFAVEVIGSASFGIEKVAYFEIDIEASADAEKFLLVARVSPNSYLIHPDLFHLQGDFALGIWYQPDSDFVLSIGGFHPAFSEPQRYVDAFHGLGRVQVDAIVYGFVHLSVECFFACTSQALMAGASVSLSATFAGIGAGLDVYIDVLMTWEPFYITAEVGVAVWFEFLGRHEIGVGLQIWTPEFGGLAHISLFVVSFDISFGADQHTPKPPTLDQFITRQLGAPATGVPNVTASLSMFNNAGQAGLMRLDVTRGRLRAGSPTGTKPDKGQQEGLSDPILVDVEFAFRVYSRLPVKPDSDTASQAVNGALSLPLCQRLPQTTLKAILTLEAKSQRTGSVNLVNDPADPKHQRLELIRQHYPRAEFGDLPISAPAQAENSDARAQIASMDTEHGSVVLVSGLTVNWLPTMSPPDSKQLASGAFVDESGLGQVYPLPLGLPAGQQPTARIPKSLHRLGRVPLIAFTTGEARPRRGIKPAASRPPVVQQVGQFARRPVLARPSGLSPGPLPQGVVSIPPPPSPARSTDLYGVSLRLTAPHAPAPIGQVEPARLSTPDPPAAAVPASPTSATLEPGAAVHFQLDAATAGGSQFVTSGNQIVRAILLNERDRPLADRYLAGNQPIVLADGARRLVCIGEGGSAPISTGVAATARESVGVERDTALLVLGSGTYAAHGCVVSSNARLPRRPDVLSTLPGSLILQGASSLSILFPAVPSGWTLAVGTVAQVPQPGPITDQVRWLAVDAQLGNLRAVAAPGRAAFLMPVAASGPWTLHLELGPQWQLLGVAVTDLSVADLTTLYQSTDVWDLIDDRFELPSAGVSTSLTLESAAS
jgi:hypothetical protein